MAVVVVEVFIVVVVVVVVVVVLPGTILKLEHYKEPLLLNIFY